jgi:hypothetical protein
LSCKRSPVPYGATFVSEAIEFKEEQSDAAHSADAKG